MPCYEHYFWQIQLWKVRKVDPTFLLHRPSALQSGIDAGCQTSSYIGNKERAPKFSLGRLRFQWTRHTFWMKVALWFNHSKWFTRPAFSSILSISLFLCQCTLKISHLASWAKILFTNFGTDGWLEKTELDQYSFNKPLNFRCGNLMIHLQQKSWRNSKRNWYRKTI